MRLIDADALKAKMLDYYECVSPNTSKETYRGETLMAYEVADMIEDCIDNAPTIDPSSLVKRGRWVPYENEADKGFHYCSECRRQAFNYFEIYEDGTEVNEVLSNYCLNCGALMEDCDGEID